MANKVLFIDSDILWEYGHVEKILNSPYPVVSGVYLDVDGNCAYKKVGATKIATQEEFAQETEPFEIQSSGFGFVACSYKVLYDIGYPWFEIQQSLVEENGVLEHRVIGEDVDFFNKVKKAGYTAMVDPSIVVTHEKLTPLTPRLSKEQY